MSDNEPDYSRFKEITDMQRTMQAKAGALEDIVADAAYKHKLRDVGEDEKAGAGFGVAVYDATRAQILEDLGLDKDTPYGILDPMIAEVIGGSREELDSKYQDKDADALTLQEIAGISGRVKETVVQVYDQHAQAKLNSLANEDLEDFRAYMAEDFAEPVGLENFTEAAAQMTPTVAAAKGMYTRLLQLYGLKSQGDSQTEAVGKIVGKIQEDIDRNLGEE